MRSFDHGREGGYLVPTLDTVVLGKWLDRPVRITTYSKSFRNSREFSYSVLPWRFRILFFGDSFVEGMRTDQSQTIGYIREQPLNTEACNDQGDAYEVMVSVHNNPADAWYSYQEFGRRYHQQLVIVGVMLGSDLPPHSDGKSELSFGTGTSDRSQPATDKQGNRVLVGKTHLFRAHGDMHFNENGQALGARDLSTLVQQRLERQGLRSRAGPVS